MAKKLLIAALWWRTSGQGRDCCGADCGPGLDPPQPATCPDVPSQTAPETMTHTEHYAGQFATSCASAHAGTSARFGVTILSYDCPHLCNPSLYGDELFRQCCGFCRGQSTGWDNGHRNFTHCKGCPGNQTQGITDNETGACFRKRVTDAMLDRLREQQFTAASVNQTAMQDVNGVATVVSAGASVAPGAARLLQTATTGTGAQHDIAQSNLPYGTHCAAGVPVPCSETFSFNIINCRDCHGVPVLEQACCRDCGCAMEGANAQSEYRFCDGCACHAASAPGAVGNTTTGQLEYHLLLQFLNNFLDGCPDVANETAATPGQCSSTPAPVQPVPPAPVPPAPVPPAPVQPTAAPAIVRGQIPLTFDNPEEVLNNPSAPSAAIGAAIADLTGVSASDVTVRLSDASIASRRLMSNSAQATDFADDAHFEDVTDESVDKMPAMMRRLSGVVNAAFDITTNNQGAATNAETALNSWPPSHILQTIDSHLSTAGIAPATSLGDLTIFHGSPSATAAPAVETPASGASGTWAPAVIGVVVALILAGVAAAVCMASSNSKSPKKASTKRAVKRGGRDESPAPGDNATVLQAPPNALQVQPTVTTPLPVLAAPTMSAPMSVARPLQPAQAVSFSRPQMVAPQMTTTVVQR